MMRLPERAGVSGAAAGRFLGRPHAGVREKMPRRKVPPPLVNAPRWSASPVVDPMSSDPCRHLSDSRGGLGPSSAGKGMADSATMSLPSLAQRARQTRNAASSMRAPKCMQETRETFRAQTKHSRKAIYVFVVLSVLLHVCCCFFNTLL